MRRLAHEAADSGLLSPELAAGISRVKGVKQLGFRSGNWLSAQQSSQVLKHASGDSMRAKRDYAMLAIPGQAIKTFQEVTAQRPTSASQGRSSRQSTTFSGYSAATLLRSSTHSGVMCQSHPAPLQAAHNVLWRHFKTLEGLSKQSGRGQSMFRT